VDPKPSLSPWQAGALVVGSMVGTGAFTTSGFLLEQVGRGWAVLLVWALAGGLALAGAAVYGELGAMMPRVGGEYVYLSRLHPALGFLGGWVSLIVGFAAPMAAGAAAFSLYLQKAWPAAPGRWSGLLLLALVTLLHALDVRRAGRLQVWATVVNLAAIVGLIAAGVWALASGAGAIASEAAPALPAPTLSRFAVGLVMVSYSYFGWNAAAYVAGELHDPGRTLPRVLLFGCLLVTVLYVGLNAVLLQLVPAAEAAGRLEIAHLAAERALGLPAARLLSLLIAFVMAVSVSALTMTGARVSLAMAEDGRFFRVFARRNSRGAPTAGVVLEGGLALILAITSTFETLLVYVGFTLSLGAAACVLAALLLRRREPQAPRPYRTPGWPLVPLAYLALTLWITIESIAQRPRESAAGALTLAVGLLLYAVWRRPGHS
jgi:basic amino acid/polyamine antiporter, APA family